MHSLYSLACCLMALSYVFAATGSNTVNHSAGETGARILVERQEEGMRIQGAFVNDSTWTGELAYELDVQRTGSAGTSQTTQSGTFETAPGQADTLSTVQINVQSGDRVEAHLTIRWEEKLIDETRLQRHIE